MVVAKVEIPFEELKYLKEAIPDYKLLTVIDKTYRENYAENKEWKQLNELISKLYNQRTELENTIRIQKHIKNGN